MDKAQLQRELARRYKPVAETKEDRKRLFEDPELKAAYDALEEEYAALDALLKARKEAGLTQAQVAERMGTTASAVARLEGAIVREKHSPTFATLKKYARACGKSLRITLV
ncbi:helix-turn-helix domain-containing protein [Caballeronia sp. BR00000012568055]|uniref:helix-turn-helix domain-containing protein n=1 Tax=Caballeronia sp. BR00000012568055 TaxID=2918761 RepID=UPI0023F94DDD|nr:helix-turn-helix transcriptional regulator [Caballeronia sp. BR00000012568055]